MVSGGAENGVASDDDIDYLVDHYSGTDYILDIKTFQWMFNYYPTNWSHYKVTNSARLRLIDTAAKNVVAESMCQSVQGDDDNPPTKDNLFNDNARLLKEYLHKGPQPVASKYSQIRS